MRERQFPCQGCGGTMEFDPGVATLRCPYCGVENEIPDAEATIEELDYQAHLERAQADEETQERLLFKCPSCAAESTPPENVTAAKCPFCGTSMVQTAEAKKSFRPRSLLPFRIDRKAAFERMQGWLAKLWFAPSDLARQARKEDALNGVYVPYWTYDADTNSDYTGQRGEDYWDTEHYTTTENGKTVHKTRRVRKTRWYHVSGHVHDDFDDVLVLASESLPQRYTEKLEPWDLDDLVPYSDDYLSGFQAECYQLGLEECFGRARQIMDTAIRASVRRDIGGDHQRIHSVRTRYRDVTFKHILLPIWVSAYRYRERLYRFVVNGRTGEVQGERPWSVWKIAGLVTLILAVIATVAIVIASTQ